MLRGHPKVVFGFLIPALPAQESTEADPLAAFLLCPWKGAADRGSTLLLSAQD
jgi:hypothetical protein